MKALYAYFMHGVEPVKQANRPSDIPWPLNMRWPLALWNKVFLDTTPYADKPSRDVVWNRGAYLVQGRALRVVPHAARRRLPGEGARRRRRGVPVGRADRQLVRVEPDRRQHGRPLERGRGRAVPEDRREPPCDRVRLDGQRDQPQHAGAHRRRSGGDLALPEIAAGGGRHGRAVVQLRSEGDAGRAGPAGGRSGAKVYNAYCLHCHGADGRGYALLAPLAGNPNVLEADASSLINVTLNGSDTLVIDGVPSAYPMPAFSNQLNDRQIADVLTFMRAGWNNGAPAVQAADVAKLRRRRRPLSAAPCGTRAGRRAAAAGCVPAPATWLFQSTGARPFAAARVYRRNVGVSGWLT